MSGIKSFAAYVSFFRLDRNEPAWAWKGATMAGKKAAANYDEDSLTMAAEAGRNCLMAVVACG